MKVIFISGAASPQTLSGFTEKYSRNKGIRYTQQWWDYSMACGLKSILDENIELISFPAIQTYPAGIPLMFRGGSICDENGYEINFLPILNLPILKQVCVFFSVLRRYGSFLQKNKNESIIILTHYIYPQSAIPAFILRLFYKRVKVCTIVPDLPSHGSTFVFKEHNFLHGLLGLYKKLEIIIQKKYDAYVCFAEPQMEHLNQSSPHIVMEGFVDSSVFDDVQPTKGNGKYVIMYAGGLHERYGVRTLVNAFIKANLQNAELHLYGQGDSVEYIKRQADHGVIYKGSVTRTEVIANEKSASLLINPRPSSEEFSRCSFPSKLLEYLAIGVPVLTTHLGCIEKEYDSLFNYIEDESVEGMASAIRFCFENSEKLNKKASVSQQYVKEYKNVYVQAKKIVVFLNTL